MEDNLSLAQISDRLDHVQDQIDTHFSTVNSSDTHILVRDKFFGKRNLNIFIRLDEFSLNKLKEAIPRMEALLREYRGLRKRESAELEKVGIDQTIRSQIDPHSHLY